MKCKEKTKGGFTLVEILVALAVMGIVMVPAMGLFSAAWDSNQRSIRNTRALTVARDIMDRIKTGDIDQKNMDLEIGRYEVEHRIEISVQQVDTGEGGNLDLIRVYVTQDTDTDPNSEGIMLTTYAADVYIDEIDATQLYNPCPHQGDDIQDPPDPGEGNDPDSLCMGYYDYASGMTTYGSGVERTIEVLPLIILDRVPEVKTIRQAVLASYSILRTAKIVHPELGSVIHWQPFKSTVQEHCQCKLLPDDHNNYQPYWPGRQVMQ